MRLDNRSTKEKFLMKWAFRFGRLLGKFERKPSKRKK